MIHDKDYILRIVKQFSEFLSNLILDNSESGLPEQERIFETNMNDTFKMNFASLCEKSTEEITNIIESKDSSHHVPFYELLGNLFYFKNKENPDPDLALKAKVFYELYLQKSGIFSLPVISRINTLKEHM